MRTVLVCTVGTSLTGNLMRSQILEHQELTRRKNSRALSISLSALDPEERLLGAEINSVTSILRSGKLAQRDRLYLLISDTEDGAFVGDVLKHYYTHSNNPFRFDHVQVLIISGLTDTSPERFRTEGLRNLVKAISQIVRRHGSNTTLINATGGYKAQISFAGMIGQALEIPVCYLFERFSEVIELPPQPISMDLSFWMDNADTFFILAERCLSLNLQEPDQHLRDLLSAIHTDERFASLIDEVEVAGQKMIGLSAVGQLFHETFRYRFLQKKQLMLPSDSGLLPHQKTIKYEDDNTGKHSGLKRYLEKLLDVPYVTRIYTFYYDKDLPLPKYFRASAKGTVSSLDGAYSDGKATTKFTVVTTAKTTGERNAAMADLNEKYL